MTTPSAKLNSGYSIPIVGLGTWKSDTGKVQAAVEHAIEVGYRHFDCAFIYFNESEVGNAVQKKIKEGKIRREDLFITTKLWNTFHSPCDVRPAFTDSLSKLKLNYVDLYLIHFPFSFVNQNDDPTPRDESGEFIDGFVDYMDTWKELEKLKHEGLAKSIGVSNFNEFQLQRLIREGSIPPAINQIELNPYLTQVGLVAFCKQQDIAVIGYSPLGSPDRPWALAGEPCLLDEPVLNEIAARLNKSVAQVVLRFQIQRGVIVIPKSVTPSRIDSNFKIFDFELTADDMEILSSFNRNFRALDKGSKMRYYPFCNNYTE